MDIELKVTDITVFFGQPILVLKEAAGDRLLVIYIGAPEAQAIALAKEHVTPPRPMTHDLLKNIMELTDISVEKIVITEVKEATYYAQIYLKKEARSFAVDARPSDAVALAERVNCPIFADDKLLIKNSLPEKPNDPDKSDAPPEDYETLRKMLNQGPKES